MEKIYNISIVLSFFGLWLTSMVPETFEILTAFLLIFSFGILHGANDILLIATIANKKEKHPFLRILISYITTVLSAVVLFYYIPALAFVLFLVFSAYHFGEQHWESKTTYHIKFLTTMFFTLYGSFVLTILFIFNRQEVIEVVSSITHFVLPETIFTYILITASVALLVLTAIIYKSISKFTSILLKELFYLLVFTILFKASTLIWGFALYFILWHSLPSLFEQIQFIYGNSKKAAIKSYFKAAFPYWIASLIGISIVIFMFKDEKLLYAILFSFIAAITFPHALVIHKMFEHKKTQSN